MTQIRARDFKADRAWGSVRLAQFEDAASVKLYWTDKPYVWHRNDGPEVMAVLDGRIDMHTRQDGVESVIRLETGDLMYFQDGDEHVAHPVGEARLLVIERPGSP